MAGEWIKMRNDLADDPAVIGMAVALNADEDTIVGKLHRLWSWADRQSCDGNAVSVSRIWIDRYLRCEGFAEAMASVGWLLIEEKSITFPNFDRHNGKTAKQRALTAKRVANHKVKSNANGNGAGNAASVSSALPREEKRREEQKPPIPPKGDGKQAKPKKSKAGPTTLATYLTDCEERKADPIPTTDAVWRSAEASGLPRDWIPLAWWAFQGRYLANPGDKAKRYTSWPQAFRNCVRENWLKLWWPTDDGGYRLSPAGVQAQREMESAA